MATAVTLNGETHFIDSPQDRAADKREQSEREQRLIAETRAATLREAARLVRKGAPVAESPGPLFTGGVRTAERCWAEEFDLLAASTVPPATSAADARGEGETTLRVEIERAINGTSAERERAAVLNAARDRVVEAADEWGLLRQQAKPSVKNVIRNNRQMEEAVAAYRALRDQEPKG